MRCQGGRHLPARLALLPRALYHVTHLTQSPAGFAGSPDNRGGTGWMFFRQSSKQ